MKKTILITAYAVNPYKGSEDGSGWNFIREAARYNNVIAVTRVNNGPHIERFLKEDHSFPHENLTMLYFDLPYWMRFWKRKSHGALLYFYLWQWFMPAFIKRQHLEFHLVHNLNFHNDWAPSFLYRLHKPFVWGPMEHHPPIPKQYLLPVYGYRAFLIDRLATFTKNILRRCNPYMRYALKKADLVIAGHQGVIRKQPVKVKRTEKMSLVGTLIPNTLALKKKDHRFTVISVGRFVPLKGFDVTIKSFGIFYRSLFEDEKKKVSLKLVGKGPLLNYMKKLIVEEGIKEVTEIIPWIPQNELMHFYETSDVFLFPSHEGAGMVVMEAQAHGLPVICFDNFGPGELVSPKSALKVPHQNYPETISNFANHLDFLFHHPNELKQMSEASVEHVKNNYTWEEKGKILNRYYTEVIESKKG
jgi:glycosyltransferase involved in cell wall biosynthesis